MNRYPERKDQHYPKLGKFVGSVDEILSVDEQAPPKQRHTAIRIFERLKAEGWPRDFGAQSVNRRPLLLDHPQQPVYQRRPLVRSHLNAEELPGLASCHAP